MRGKKAFYLRVSEWGGEDLNLRPTDYESYGSRAAPSIWCRFVLSGPGQEALPESFEKVEVDVVGSTANFTATSPRST